MRISFLFEKDLLLCVKVCCLHVSLYSTCMQCPQRPEEGVRSPGAGLGERSIQILSPFLNGVVCFLDSLIPEFLVSGVSLLWDVELVPSSSYSGFLVPWGHTCRLLALIPEQMECSQEVFPAPNLVSTASVFASSFSVSAFTVRSLIHLDTFCHGNRCRSNIVYLWTSSFLCTIC